MQTFNAIDVETANADRASICQIGLVHVRDGEIADHWQTLINPEAWFDSINIAIHGIHPRDVRNAPKLPEVHDELYRRVHGSILVSHTAFDRTAFERAIARYNLEQFQVTWLDSSRIVRRAWPDHYGKRGWGLKNVAEDLGIPFKHHDALEDARVAAEIVLEACAVSKLDIAGWLQRIKRPIFPGNRRHQGISVARDGNVEGPLYGETLLFTGKLIASRQVAAEQAAHAGCAVVNTASKKVTILVVGIQDKGKLNGYEKSSKHRKVEKMIDQGMEIQILSERDFWELIRTELPE